MKNVAKALQSFFSSFDIPAYEENTVPDGAVLPYITYEVVNPDWRTATTVSANVWYAGTSLEPILSKVDEIAEKIGEGYQIPVESGGCVWLYKDTQFAQMVSTDNDNIKVVYLLIGMHALCR